MPKTLTKPGPDLGVRVLSLDGGGAGALSELLILDRMMYKAKTEGQLDMVPSPCECFELIGGSGTGGIIALMLGRLRMSVKDAISAYDSLRPQSKMGFAEQFQASKFEEALRQIFKAERMEDVSPVACKTYLCVCHESNGMPDIFRSYNTPDEPASECMIWEAARATSATPGLFKPMEIGLQGHGQQYIDGSIGNNNPTSLILEEEKLMYPTHPLMLVSSIGSGHPDVIQISQPLSSSIIAKALKMIASDCEKTHEETARKFRSTPNIYFRFNVEQGMQGLEAQHWGKSSEVSAHTNAYLRRADTKSKLTEAVRVILSKSCHTNHRLSQLFQGLPTPTPHFTGRQDILQHMTTYFNTTIGRRHVFLLHGLGGAGKSQIAFKYVEMSNFPEPRSFSEIYFNDGSTRQTIENDLVTLATTKQIGKTVKDSLLWLSHQQKEWLIVFNNADDIHLNLREFFPSGSHGNILITSRNPALGQHAQTECKVDRMELKDAINLLLTAARCDTTVQDHRAIAQRIVEVCLL
ncbi:acyl transferase/acyl hydrolase/lysophospholipase [Mycena epipterygia]|nr:acyl transferase/acyl hydrolase/lysophospholipase [Mycena epipterygia]